MSKRDRSKRDDETFTGKLKDYQGFGKGCKFCTTGACCKLLGKTLPAILSTRQTFKEMSSLQQDRDLHCFSGFAKLEQASQSSDPKECMEETSQSSDPKECMEETSQSDDARPPSAKKRKVEEEMTDRSSDNENAMNPKHQEEVMSTTSSSDFLDLEQEVAPHSHSKPKPHPRSYVKRRRLDEKKGQSIPAQSLMLSKTSIYAGRQLDFVLA